MRRAIRTRRGTTTGLRKSEKIVGNPQLYTPREKLQNYVWVFKKGDADDHPSIPHAHSKEEGYRLDAWTGDILSTRK